MSTLRKASRSRVALIRLLGGALVALALATSTGCALRTIHLRAEAGECLNPLDDYCNEYGSNSILMAVQVYQLHHEVDVSTLEWEAFVTPNQDVAALGDLLTDPEDPAVVKKRFTLTAGQKIHLKMKRKLRTRYLLVVTAGREEGSQSMALTRVPWGRKGRLLCFEYYDVSAPKGRHAVCEYSFHARPFDGEAPPLEDG